MSILSKAVKKKKLAKQDDRFQLEGPVPYVREATQLALGHKRFADPALAAKDSLMGKGPDRQRGDTEGEETRRKHQETLLREGLSEGTETCEKLRKSS